MPFYAHTKGPHKNDWEPLFTPTCPALQNKPCPDCENLTPQHGHLNKVAHLAGKFAAEMFPAGPDREAAKQWGHLAGLWHDLGKYSDRFQRRLAGENVSVDHATKGAQAITKHLPPFGHLLAYGIAGHHSGLLDTSSNGASQALRLQNQELEPTPEAPTELTDQQLSSPSPNFLKRLRDTAQPAFHLSLHTRLLFSSLVDADFLATEAFMNPSQTKKRNLPATDILQKISHLVRQKIDSFPEPAADDTINQQRKKVVNDCRAAASQAPGLFTLTVPTGGGKTLSSLQFAVDHALAHGQRRIIYVVPFTSIIEQNAEVIREILAPLETDDLLPLIEHHSSLSPDKDTLRLKLASENWDAPVIITTAVQFYESFFAAKTSRSRKIHNVANSVVIFDEAQSLPVNFLHPCLALIQELSSTFHTSCVLCTATQPAINFHEQDFPIGLKDTREIIQDRTSLFAAFDRVDIQQLGPIIDADLATRLASHDQVLCIVNRRKHAQELYQLLPEAEGNFHLSALMCPEHRYQMLATIRKRLDSSLPCRVISTQLIEAGVDIDFPAVYRSLAGLDSIAQAAGRCNRHGKQATPGQVFIFEAEDQNAEVYFRDTAQVTQRLLPDHQDILSPAAISDYFDRYYYKNQKRWDENQILDCFELRGKNKDLPLHFQFVEAAEKFRLIPEWQVPVIIPFDETAEALIADLRNESIPLHRKLLRALQRYTVQIPPRLRDDNLQNLEVLRDGEFYVIISDKLNYSDHFGLTFEQSFTSAQNLIL